MRITASSTATLSLMVTACFAVNIKQCPIGVQEYTADHVITCEDIDSNERVKWVRSKDGTDADAGLCNPLPDTCLSKLPSFMSLTRPSHGVSHMTMKNVTRSLYGGSTVTCRTFRQSTATGSASCKLDVTTSNLGIYVTDGADVAHCMVEPTRSGDKWVVSGSCSIRKTYSSMNRYKCQLLQQLQNSPETSVVETQYTPTLDNGSPPYASGSCSFTAPLPTTMGTYTYTAVVHPGAKRVSAGQIHVALPAKPPTISCQSTGGDFVEEDAYLDCTCEASDVGQPGGRLYAYRDDTLLASGTQGGSSLDLPRQTVSRDDAGTVFRCVLLVDWAPPGLQEQSASYTVSVAYGPETVNVTDPGVFDVHPSQAETMNLTCVASDASPGVNFTWTGPCAGQNQPKCTFAPKISDNGKEVACIATNLVTGEARLASVLLDLNYPPLSPPVITGVDKNAMYPGESALMTCSVPSSIPPVESVTFACLDQDEEVEGQSSTVNVTLHARNQGDKCTCTARWKHPEWYTMSSEVTLKVYGESC
ncbi:hypothetical protein BaRGS_00039727 [Batillaria attramentaria]|uniref:Ig-like domain-containing protein n=1 Tax=Batillaria attramentaria TaxID=370345 RepID=A0ABD0J270_9CAEN